MKTFDNGGNLINEMNTTFTSDGKVISTNTAYSNGHVVSQNVSERDTQGHVKTTNTLNGKLRP